uniref:(northern house mosquito) hypothetical protein n=1 Tax=Culex pipiens TaxID=7175 RepID=A0A8D8DZ98_CULPI
MSSSSLDDDQKYSVSAAFRLRRGAGIRMLSLSAAFSCSILRLASMSLSSSFFFTFLHLMLSSKSLSGSYATFFIFFGGPFRCFSLALLVVLLFTSGVSFRCSFAFGVSFAFWLLLFTVFLVSSSCFSSFCAGCFCLFA